MTHRNMIRSLTSAALALGAAFGLSLHATPASAYGAFGIHVTIDDLLDGAPPTVTFTQPPGGGIVFFSIDPAAVITNHERVDYSGVARAFPSGPLVVTFPAVPTLIMTEGPGGAPSDILHINVHSQSVCGQFCVSTPFDTHFISDGSEAFPSALAEALAGPHFFLAESGVFQDIPNADYGPFWGPIFDGDPVFFTIRSDRAPEPATLALVGGTLLGTFIRRRRKSN